VKQISLQRVFLTFKAPALAMTIKFGYERVRLQPHVSDPMECFHCQQVGYTTQRCASTILRGVCSKGWHGEAPCPTHLAC
jgi:hypothetical protein